MNRTEREVTVVGGGLAGLALGLGLRAAGTPVVVLEAQSYPRHRVCGEFLSGRGLQVLDRLGLRPLLREAGARLASTVAFYSGHRFLGHHTLPEPALCVSRHVLDARMAQALRDRGGNLRTGVRYQGDWDRPGLVRTTGRRPWIEDGGWRWFGLKAHATGVRLSADLEMHLVPDGYVGICAIEGDRVNVCGLFRSRAPLRDLGQRWPVLLAGPEDSALHRTLSAGDLDPASFTAVAGLDLRPRRARQRTECAAGDAIGMIPPATGNGMSMALESASLAIEPLTDWVRGRCDWETARQRVAETCDRSFAGRLRWAGWLQGALMSPAGRRFVEIALPAAPALWRLFYRGTR